MLFEYVWQILLKQRGNNWIDLWKLYHRSKGQGFFTVRLRENGDKMENYCVLLPFSVNAANGTDSQDADRTQKCAVVLSKHMKLREYCILELDLSM